MKIEFKVTIPDTNTIEKQIYESMKRQLTDQLEDKLSKIICLEHHESPKVLVSGSLNSPEFIIEGCCPKLIEEATNALK